MKKLLNKDEVLNEAGCELSREVEAFLNGAIKKYSSIEAQFAVTQTVDAVFALDRMKRRVEK